MAKRAAPNEIRAVVWACVKIVACLVVIVLWFSSCVGRLHHEEPEETPLPTAISGVSQECLDTVITASKLWDKHYYDYMRARPMFACTDFEEWRAAVDGTTGPYSMELLRPWLNEMCRIGPPYGPVCRDASTRGMIDSQ